MLLGVRVRTSRSRRFSEASEGSATLWSISRRFDLLLIVVRKPYSFSRNKECLGEWVWVGGRMSVWVSGWAGGLGVRNGRGFVVIRDLCLFCWFFSYIIIIFSSSPTQPSPSPPPRLSSTLILHQAASLDPHNDGYSAKLVDLAQSGLPTVRKGVERFTRWLGRCRL